MPLKYRTARQLRAAIDALEPRRLLAGDFSISCPTSITVPAGKTYQVPITTEYGDNVSFDADPSSNLTADFRSDANPWLELVTSRGTMRFQLFADLADRTVQAIRGLVDAGFYEGLTFDRVLDTADGFRIAQGGASGSGPGFTFDDEFSEEAIFDGSGQLAMANPGQDERGGKDENASAFFITGGSARALDFNHTIFGQLVRGSDVLESILDTADPNADTTIGTPRASTTILGARLIDDDTDAVMTLRAGSKAGSRTVTVTAVDEDGDSVSKTIKVRVVPEIYATPPILKLPSGDTFSAGSGQTLSIPFEVLDLEADLFDARINIEAGGSYVDQANSRIDLDNKKVIFTIKPGASGKVEFRLGVSGYNAVSRGSIVWQPGDSSNSLRVFDTQLITIAVNGTPIERTASSGTIAARVGDEDSLKDATLATFESDDDADKDDFYATINWGDGSGLDEARIERLSKGKFAVVSHDGHAYRRASSATPVTIALSGVNGSRAVVRAFAVVGDPASLSSDGTLTIRGTSGDDDVRLSSDDDGKLIVRAGDDRFSFTQSSVKRIVVDLFDGDDKLQTVDAEGLPAMTIRGGAGSDSLYGGDAGDRLEGGDGDDELYGNGGDDSIYGSDGDEYMLGGSGKNFLYGEAGEDRIIGGGGRDFISGGEDSDRLYGRNGDDTIEGNAGTDRLYGEDGNDRLIGGSSNDRLYAGNGDDTLWGNSGSDTLNGGPGVNTRGDRDDDDTLIDVVG